MSFFDGFIKGQSMKNNPRTATAANLVRELAGSDNSLTSQDIRELIAAVKMIGIRGGMLAEGCSDRMVVHLASSKQDLEICMDRWTSRPTN